MKFSHVTCVMVKTWLTLNIYGIFTHSSSLLQLFFNDYLHGQRVKDSVIIHARFLQMLLNLTATMESSQCGRLNQYRAGFHRFKKCLAVCGISVSNEQRYAGVKALQHRLQNNVACGLHWGHQTSRETHQAPYQPGQVAHSQAPLNWLNKWSWMYACVLGSITVPESLVPLHPLKTLRK